MQSLPNYFTVLCVFNVMIKSDLQYFVHGTVEIAQYPLSFRFRVPCHGRRYQHLLLRLVMERRLIERDFLNHTLGSALRACVPHEERQPPSNTHTHRRSRGGGRIRNASQAPLDHRQRGSLAPAGARWCQLARLYALGTRRGAFAGWRDTVSH